MKAPTDEAPYLVASPARRESVRARWALRELIRARTGDGRKRAKERGVRFGRPRKLTPHQRQEALARLEAGETQADVARTYNVDATTIGRLQPSPFDGASAAA